MWIEYFLEGIQISIPFVVVLVKDNLFPDSNATNQSKYYSIPIFSLKQQQDHINNIASKQHVNM